MKYVQFFKTLHPYPVSCDKLYKYMSSSYVVIIQGWMFQNYKNHSFSII